MRKNIILTVILISLSFLICSNVYCENAPAQPIKEKPGDTYKESVSALSVNDTKARTNTVEAVVTNKNLINAAAQNISNTNPKQSAKSDQIRIVSGDMVVDGSFTIPEGQILIIDGSLTINSGLTLTQQILDNNILNISDQGSMITTVIEPSSLSGNIIMNGPLTILDGQTLTFNGPLTINSGGTSITSGTVNSGFGSTISITSTQTPITDLSSSGTISIPATDIADANNDTINTGNTMVVNTSSTAEVKDKLGNREEEERQMRISRDRIEKQRQILKDILNESGDENIDSKKKESSSQRKQN